MAGKTTTSGITIQRGPELRRASRPEETRTTARRPG